MNENRPWLIKSPERGLLFNNTIIILANEQEERMASSGQALGWEAENNIQNKK